MIKNNYMFYKGYHHITIKLTKVNTPKRKKSCLLKVTNCREKIFILGVLQNLSLMGMGYRQENADLQRQGNSKLKSPTSLQIKIEKLSFLVISFIY